EHRTLAAWPAVFRQRSSQSDIYLGNWKDRIPGVGRLRQLKDAVS
ncbi:hypothetical protein GGQ59_002733, partial [Parvularcula dongshanensis]|nr:hypothetical protein [Parvularcula dongshanensis]